VTDPDKSRQQAFVDLMSGRQRGFKASLLRGAAGVGSVLYDTSLTARNRAYDIGLLPRHRLNEPVISVGNLTVGGTGKTVLVAQIARWLIDAGHRPAVLMRGYLAERSATGSDEAALLRDSVPGLIVAPDPDRVAAGRRLLVADNPPDCFILDDGFQHRRLRRDLDIVTLDATTDPDGPLARPLPRGLMRESWRGLRRADYVVITRADQAPDIHLERLVRIIRKIDAALPILQCRHEPTGLRIGKKLRPIADLEGNRYLAFCGIGNPAAFSMTVRNLPGECVDFVPFDDHHPYTRDELDGLADRAARAGAHLLLTTSKDAVRINSIRTSPPIRSVEVGLGWLGAEGERPLRELVLDRAEKG
jgi:tetraacyldisaccharide 4'-kinase